MKRFSKLKNKKGFTLLETLSALSHSVLSAESARTAVRLSNLMNMIFRHCALSPARKSIMARDAPSAVKRVIRAESPFMRSSS